MSSSRPTPTETKLTSTTKIDSALNRELNQFITNINTNAKNFSQMILEGEAKHQSPADKFSKAQFGVCIDDKIYPRSFPTIADDILNPKPKPRPSKK